MNLAIRLLIGLMACTWLQLAWCSDAIPGTVEECIEEPIFEGKVCTLQANPDARVGVILIHGLGGSIEDWQKTIPALAESFHVVAFDLPGFGKSDKGSQDYSPARYASLAHFLADHYFQDKTYHIVGHSMGGAIALRFASQRPLRFQRLVLIDAAGILHPQVLTKFQAGSTVKSPSSAISTRGFVEKLSGRILEEMDRMPISPFDIANSSLGRDYVLMGGPQSIAALKLAGEDFSNAITPVTEPTLILWGDNDETVPLRTGKVLAAHMPQARLEIIAGSGHVPMLEQTEQTNTLILKHLLASDQELAGQYPSAPPLPEFSSEREGSCSGKNGLVFEGDYRSIDLSDCSNITIRNARVGKLSITNSAVTMIDTDISGKDEGLISVDSNVAITNGSISGKTAIQTTRSRLDLAGVYLKGSKNAVKSEGSKLLFSICRVHSPHTDGSLHAYKKMDDGVL